MSGSKYAEVGDWIRFMRDSRLVIGEVRYVERDRWGGDATVVTDCGSVSSDEVLEIRRASERVHRD